MPSGRGWSRCCLAGRRRAARRSGRSGSSSTPIRWRCRVGAPWRDVPAEYGSWQAVYGLLRRWQRAGSLAAIVTSLQAVADAAGVIDWQVSVDSTITRAHPHAAGARRDGAGQAEPPAGPGQCEPGDHGLGRSRGGWTSKLHLACDQGCRVLSVLVTAGQAGDSPQFTAVLDAIVVPKLGGGRARVRPERVLADKAYSGRGNREWLRRHGIRATIPVPADQAEHRRRRGRGGGRPRHSMRRSTGTAMLSSGGINQLNSTGR
ncbi:IS5 family transposase [Nocardia elegans]|uniref:IS5 family transposase n=1 Tax=Nocardia elegans TaxID=300029 RepID=A0ABW6TPT1_9NOCA